MEELLSPIFGCIGKNKTTFTSPQDPSSYEEEI
jgi:hypothetical protein